jgi:hypothetical protein
MLEGLSEGLDRLWFSEGFRESFQRDWTGCDVVSFSRDRIGSQRDRIGFRFSSLVVLPGIRSGEKRYDQPTYISTSRRFRSNRKCAEILFIFLVLGQSEVEKGHFFYFLMVFMVRVGLDLFQYGHGLVDLLAC